MRKPICRQSEALLRLEALVAKLNSEGQVFLPSERDLCEMVGTSRKTLQKALKELERSGSLETGSRGRIINAAPKAPLKGELLFIGAGVDWLTLPAWNRLWIAFEEQARLQGWGCRQKLWRGDAPWNPADLEGFDFILFSGVGGSWEREFRKFAEGRDNIIGVQEDQAAFLRNVVCLDNREAGRMAAKLIFDAGYKRPALVRQDNGYTGFLRREEGFLEKTRELFHGYEAPCYRAEGLNTSSYVRNLLDQVDALAASDADAVFAASDELINIVYEPFACKGEIPKDYGFVAVSGSHEGLLHQPPVTSVSHASHAVARAALALMDLIREGKRPDGDILRFVKPSVHQGATLRGRKGPSRK